ncbi:YybH family protein [Arenimonas sp.]|uniref:YybH family protein n=1 Tax=Arenimonas sp. TaxID=1872635 RepID=UPI0039E51577
MSQTRPSPIATVSAVLASMLAGLFGMPSSGKSETLDARAAVSELTRRSEEANAALLRGDVARWQELLPLSDDFTLMSPFGGVPSRRSEYTTDRIESMGRFFKGGTLEQEVVQTYAADDMVVLAVIERARVSVGDTPVQPWALRVTLVYRRVGETWLLAHRHADPLAAGVSLEEAARLARGE